MSVTVSNGAARRMAVDEVERVLAAQVPRRPCVVQSRYTAAQLRDVEDVFTACAPEGLFALHPAMIPPD